MNNGGEIVPRQQDILFGIRAEGARCLQWINKKKENPKRGSRHLLNHLYLHFSLLSYRLLIHQKAMWVESVGANQPQQSQSLVGGRNLYSMWYINVQGVVFSQITFPFSRALQQSVDSITFRWNLICLILSEMSELTSLTCLFLAGLWPDALLRPLMAYLTLRCLFFRFSSQAGI